MKAGSVLPFQKQAALGRKAIIIRFKRTDV